MVKRELFFVDVGLKVTLEEDAGPGRPISFKLGVPFTSRTKSEKVRDLIPLLAIDKELCALVFGASDLKIDVKKNEGWKSGTWIEDGGTTDAGGNLVPSQMLLVSLEQAKCSEIERSDNADYSTWEMSCGDKEVKSGYSAYLRFRFVTRKPGRVWDWQRALGSSAHAISDLRVSDFREKPSLTNPPNYATEVLDSGRVNGFVITSSALKAGRVSPQPKYVRVLENSSWEKYLGRHLGRRGERFLITYWTRQDVTQGGPFRSFLEVERRRPTAVRSVTVATLVLLASMALLQPLFWLRASPVGEAVASVWNFAWPLLSAVGVFGVGRFLWGQIWKSGDRWEKARQLVEKVDERRFRI
ncbi:MAG: hypothetical protein V9F00_14925 [Nocardioides sp.]